MDIEGLIKWYQKKIGTYDKQQWEKNMEQRIIYGINHIQKKRTTPKTDLIDLDLVRGSSFTKAKPKHGLLTVARLSTLRILLLPLYSKWWVKQTSGQLFGILLGMYFCQLVNIAIYSYHSPTSSTSSTEEVLEAVPTSEIVVPMLMMWVLSFVHSQIVATSPGPDIKLQAKFTNKTYRRRKVRHLVFMNDDGVSGKSSKWKGKDKLNRTNSRDTTKKIKKLARKRNVVDDDGFESLNGNGSSPSDYGATQGSKIHFAVGTEKNALGIRCDQWVKDVQKGTKVGRLNRRRSAPDLRIGCVLDPDTDSDDSVDELHVRLPLRRNSQIPVLREVQVESVCDTDEEGECETLSSPETGSGGLKINTPSGNEWTGVTTNSEDCSYSSDFSASDSQTENGDNDAPPTSILSPYCGPSDRISCTIWEKREIKKADLAVFDISSAIIAKVETMPESCDYFYIGIFVTTIISILPVVCRFCYTAIDLSNFEEMQISFSQLFHLVILKFANSFSEVIDATFGTAPWQRVFFLISMIQRWVLGFLLFFLLVVAERTFKQRFLYGKFFSHLTSSRRAKKSELPHFRLNKVRNIKTWLSVRSYLRKRGPQRSIDVIVSVAFIATILLLSFLCMELLKESFVLNSRYNLEIMTWSIGLGIMVLRFMTLGVKINKKYSNLSVLITEQINLYLQIEQKPNKKEELMVANSVLKLAADLLKELESQFKILGLSANPFLYNITKVVILSALSGVLSEILGFKLKLHKIKIK